MAATRALDRQRRRSADATLPVIEIFGPTVQGEGPDAGRPAYFVRFGGCDFRCSWCDSMYAVDPAEVRSNAERLSAHAIEERLCALEPGPTLVVLSGGNPALLDLVELVERLQAAGAEVAIETQGSLWREWLAAADRLVVSPKGPSSGMDTPAHRAQFAEFMARAAEASAALCLKVVVFDDRDLDYFAEITAKHPDVPAFVSVGSDVGLPDEETRTELLLRYRWLCETVARRPEFSRARVLPQLHVLAWGTARGV
jgi:7-carboxy-7-deazaguanine synthase